MCGLSNFHTKATTTACVLNFRRFIYDLFTTEKLLIGESSSWKLHLYIWINQITISINYKFSAFS